MDCKSWKEAKTLTTCAICEKPFEKPRTLICCHTFCESCIMRSDVKKCPSCPDDITGNKLIPFKTVRFENLLLSRLTAIITNKEAIARRMHPIRNIDLYVICTDCYMIKPKDHILTTDKTICHNFCQVNLYNTPEKLLECTLRQVCRTCGGVITKYCFTCHKEHCDECFDVHEHHKSDTVKCIKDKLFEYLAKLQQDGIIHKEIHRAIIDLEQCRDTLYKLYKEGYALTEQSYDHKIHSLCEQKQIVLSKLMRLWSIIEKTINSYKIEIFDLQKLMNNFYTYLVPTIEKSSDKEIITYFIKAKRQFVVSNVIELLKDTIHMIQKERKIFLHEDHISQKLKEQTQVTKNNSFVCTDLSAIPHSRIGRAFKQEYQCLNYEDKRFKIEQIQVNMLGEEYSMFTLPLPSSKLVKATKQQFMVLSKCAQCLSQLQLFSRALGKKYSELGQKEIIKSLSNNLLSSNKQLLSITTNAIARIKTAITYLQSKDVSSYCKVLKENLGKLETFIKKLDEWYKELNVFYLEQQKLHITQDHTAIGKSSVAYVSMLIDIMIDCRTHIANTKQICENFFGIEKTVEILCKEKHDKEYNQQLFTRKVSNLTSSDGLKKLIASSGFQLQIVRSTL